MENDNETADDIKRAITKEYCSSKSCLLVLTCAVLVVSIVLIMCDRYTVYWLEYFENITSNIVIPF